MSQPDRFVLDGSYRRPGDGPMIIAGSPLRLFRLSPAGRRVAQALERGESLPAGHQRLTDRLLDAGAVHPRIDDGVAARGRSGGVIAVVPAYGVTDVAHVADAVRTIVVDDGSPQPIGVDRHSVVIHLTENGGPAAARNAGLGEVDTDFVAFVDTDVVAPPGWLAPLMVHFTDPRVALVAPRVRTSNGGSPTVDAYEQANGSLDLGPAAGRIASGSRVSFVPASAIVCRVEAMRSIGGFDAALRYGEDVDLVWRLHEARWRCRYEPSSVVWHAARPTMLAWLSQRFRYGTSAAPLALRHPGALAPLRVSGWTVVVWALITARRPSAALAVAVGTVVALQRKLADVPATECARLAGLGHLRAGEQIASAIRRAWWPVAVLAGALRRRVRPAIVAAVVGPPTVEWLRRRPPLPPLRFTFMRIADDVAYGTGVWIGCVRTRSATALLPDLAGWPPRAASTVTTR